MDHNPNTPRNEDESGASLPVSGNDASEIVPLPKEERSAPPVDIDEREAGTPATEPVPLPGVGDWSGDSADQIDEHQPLPVSGEYHDDDAVAPDPYDVDDQIDLTMPRPLRAPVGETDDASTKEELDVDTTPDRRENDEEDAGRVRFAAPDENDAVAGDRVYAGGPDDEPVNQESELFEPEQSNDTFDAGSIPDDEAIASTGGPAPAPPGAESGETTCPVCGRRTDALRFCGFCGAKLTEDRPRLTSSTTTGRLLERIEHVLSPLGHWTRPGGVRFIMAAGSLLVLLALLANNGALALMIGAAILPLILVFWCMHSDVFENEPLPILGGFGMAGIVIGAVLGWLSALIVASTWFDSGVLNYGAAGLGGSFAEHAGSPPFLAWSLAGIIFPLLALAAIIGLPLAIRQTVSLRNEIMDGLTLGALIGGGISLGSAIVFAAPMLTHGGPGSDASTWTLTIIGLTVIRPLVWTLCGGLLGAATWRYLVTAQIAQAFIPAVVGAAGVLLFTFISIQVSASGLWSEVLWGVIVAIVVGFFYMRTMNRALASDRSLLGNDDSRVICPHCHQVTPAGQYCAHCGEELTSA